MTPLPVPYRSNPSPYKIGGGSFVYNAYVEEGADDNKANYMLLPCAGMKNFGDALEGRNRGMIYVEDQNRLYAVNGIQIYEVQEDGTSTALGLIGGDDYVRTARNDASPQQVAFLSEGNLSFLQDGVLSVKSYSFENTDGTFQDITPIDVTYCGGRFVYPVSEFPGRFYWTDLLGNTVSGLNFATAEGNPDGLNAVHGEIDVLYLFGSGTTEVWGLTTDADQPFQRIGGGHLLIGSNSKHTIRSFNNAVAMVGSDNVVYLIRGTEYKPFSSNEVSRLIEADPNKSDIVAFTHERGENKFYTLQGTGWTREYNSKTDTWANRQDVGRDHWHCVNCATVWNKRIFGDLITGQLYEADYTIFTDAGNEMEWGFDTNIIHDSPNGLAFNKVALDMETGGGIDYENDGKVMLDWSDDNGRSWKGSRILSLGKVGEYRKRVRTNRLGRTGEKGRVFRVRVTDNTVRAIAGMYGDIEGVTL